MYQTVGIAKLSDNQLSRLRNGHPVRVKLGNFHKIALNIQQLKKLNTDEKNLLNSILYMAGLHKKIITDTNESLLNLKQKFKTIEGEFLSGNNNPQVLTELKQVLLKLFHLGALSKNSLKKYLSQFK